MYNWNDKIIDKVYIEMDYKKARPYKATVEYRLIDGGDVYPLHLNDANEIDRCVDAFTKQTKKNKYQLEKEEKRLFYSDKDDKKSINSHLVENDLVNNRIMKPHRVPPKKSGNVVKNFKLVAAFAVISVVLIEGCHLLKKINGKDNILTYRNPDKKIETMSDRMVISGYEKAKEIFYKLLEHSDNVSSNDIMFLTDFLTYASMTNSDYKENITYTKFATADVFCKTLNSDRDSINSITISNFLNLEEELYSKCYLPNVEYDRYYFNDDEAYKYFVYVTSLIKGGELSHTTNSDYYGKNMMVADKTDNSLFRNQLTPLERITIYTRLKGFLNGDFEFKYKRDVTLSSYDLTKYNKTEYMQWLDNQIAYEQQNLIHENTKNAGKSR